MGKWTDEDLKFLKEDYKIIKTQDIAKKLGKKIHSIRAKAFKIGICDSVCSQYKKNELFFNSPNLENSYWAGFIAADGCIRSSINQITIGINKIDQDILYQFKSACQYSGHVFYYDVTQKSGYISHMCRICIGNATKWIQDLRTNFNISVNKTSKLLPPINLNFENSLAYIIGYIDGDGTISFDRNYLRLRISGLPIVINWIKNIFLIIEPKIITNNLYYNKTVKDFCELSLLGNKSVTIFNVLNKVEIPFKLPRKWNIL